MSKRSLDLATDSNGSRMPFDIHFKPSESSLLRAGRPFELLRIRSNTLERRRAALHA